MILNSILQIESSLSGVLLSNEMAWNLKSYDGRPLNYSRNTITFRTGNEEKIISIDLDDCDGNQDRNYANIVMIIMHRFGIKLACANTLADGLFSLISQDIIKIQDDIRIFLDIPEDFHCINLSIGINQYCSILLISNKILTYT